MTDEEKKVIEHLKIVAKERTIRPLDDEIGIVLNLLKEQQENYQSCMDYADSLNRDIGELLLILEKKDKIIDLMSKEIEERLGTCPFDAYEYEMENCQDCQNTYSECWKKYFTKKVGE